MKALRLAIAIAAATLPTAAFAQEREAPSLVVALSADGLSPASVALYRPSLTGGLTRFSDTNPGSGVRTQAADSRTVIVGGAAPARAAAGDGPDQLWRWEKGRFESGGAGTPAPIAARVNASIAAAMARPRAALTPPVHCPGTPEAAQLFPRKALDAEAFARSPELDGAMLAMAGALFQQMRLGRGGGTDLLAIDLPASAAIARAYGAGSTASCVGIASLDADLAAFFTLLDRSGIDYAATLSLAGGTTLFWRSPTGD